MSDLPSLRIEASPPFSYCGMDCFCSFCVKDGRKEVKRYGLIVTCLASRAVYLEVLDDMPTDSLINGLRNVIPIRGQVRLIRCDRGTNFVGASNE
ncbi:Gag-pol fusion polyprotein [Elysia marginata]|uniref:Gag-pol fusion polyprotein n=1 Tax=Elysia marginata TaxID=1093978 RepID=A0AAV4HF89_9GAST|nr:Gag-pol fusion polyprotein [Elysia marginata]